MLYWIGRTFFIIIFKLFFRLRIIGKNNIPKHGFIIASNHNSLIDPPLIGASIPRGVYFMAKKELFEIPILGSVIKKAHAFPVDRESPEPSSIKKAIYLLKEGKILLIFPEGTRKKVENINKGVSVLSHLSEKPVVPSRIVNNDKIKSLSQLIYIIGKPVEFPLSSSEKASPEIYDKFTDKIMKKIYDLDLIK